MLIGPILEAIARARLIKQWFEELLVLFMLRLKKYMISRPQVFMELSREEANAGIDIYNGAADVRFQRRFKPLDDIICIAD